MNRVLRYSFVSFFFYAICCAGGKSDAFVHTDQTVTAPILKLLEMTGVSHDGTLCDVVAKTQAAWLRKPGVERWQMELKDHAQAAQMMEQFKTLGMFDDLMPTQAHYTYAIIFGALMPRIIERMNCAINAWNQGYRWNKMVLLAGLRPVVPDQGEAVQDFERFAGKPIDAADIKTEADVIKFVYEHVAMPEDMRKLPAEFIVAAMIQKPDGTWVRPGTPETVQAWLQMQPVPGAIIGFSNQPFVAYQHYVLRSLIPNDFSIETVGVLNPTANPSIDLLLDTVARTLYQKQNSKF
jgi:hypothetical protein